MSLPTQGDAHLPPQEGQRVGHRGHAPRLEGAHLFSRILVVVGLMTMVDQVAPEYAHHYGCLVEDEHHQLQHYAGRFPEGVISGAWL